MPASTELAPTESEETEVPLEPRLRVSPYLERPLRSLEQAQRELRRLRRRKKPED